MAWYSRTCYHNICHWVEASDGNVPCDAVIGGMDSGESIYIGRVQHEADLLPGKIVPSHRVCYVPYASCEFPHRTYQVLVSLDQTQFDWVPESNGRLPPGAVQGGFSAKDNEALYIGRVFHEDTLTIGKIHCSHNCLYIPYNKEEVRYTYYEVLVCRTINF